MASLSPQQLTTSLELLAHPYRRYSLYHLSTESEPVTVEDLADEIVGREGKTSSNVHTESVEISLRHTHLPKLAAAGVVTVCTNTGKVTLGKTAGVVRVLDQVAAIDDRNPPAVDN